MAYESRLELTISSRRAERDLKRFEGQLDRTERAGQGVVAAMGGVTRAVSLAAAAVGGFSIARIVNETANFQQTMLGLQAVSSATADQMQRLEQQARTLGATTMFSAQQTGEAQRFLAQAGFEVNEVLSATPGILKLATAGELDLARAADIASNVLGGMRLEVSELNRVNDVLAATAAGSNTNIEQLGQALSTAAPIAATAGISIEEVAAAIGVLSDAGIQGSRAGTGVLGFIRQLSNITPQAAGVLESYGLSMSDVNIETNGLSVVLERLRNANLTTADAFAIFQSEAGPAAQVLANGADRVGEFTSELQGAEGAIDRMAEILGSGLTASIRGFNSALGESVLQLGTGGLGGALEYAIQAATGVLSVWNGMEREWAGGNEELERMLPMVNALATGLEAVAVIAGGRLLTALGAATLAQLNKTRATMADIQAEAAAAQAKAVRAAETLRVAQSEQAAAQRALANARATAALTGSTTNQTRALHQLAIANQRVAGAQAANTAAITAQTAAMTRASVVARGFSGALALLGGPAGAAVIAAGALYYFRDELGLVHKPALTAAGAVDELAVRVDGATDSMLKFEVAGFTAELVSLQRAAQQAEENIARLERTASQPYSYGQGQQGDLSDGIARHEANLESINNQIKAREQAIDTLNARIEELNANNGESDSLNRTLTVTVEDLTEAEKELNREMERQSQAASSLVDQLYPLQASQRQYMEDKALLVQHMLEENKSAEWLIEAQGLLEESYRNSEGAARAYGDTGSRAMGQVNDAARDLGMTFESAFENAIVRGEGLRDVLDGIYQDILRIAVRKSISEPFGNAIAGAFGSFFGGSPIEGGFTSQIDFGSYASGGYTGSGGKYDPAGIVHAGEFVVQKSVVEKPGVRPMLERLNRGYANGGHVGPAGSGGGAGGSPFNVYISTPPGTEARTEERQNAQGGRDLHVIIDEVVAGNISNPGSRTGRAMRNTFGAQRTLTGRG